MKHFVTTFCLAALLSAPAFAQMLVPVQDAAGRYGFQNENGAMAVAPQYDGIQFNFYQGTACVVKKGKFLLINSSGKEISKGYTWIGTFDSRDLCLFNSGGKLDEDGNPHGGKFGYLDLSGKEIIPAKYDFIGEFNNYNVAVVLSGAKSDKYGALSGGKFGFIDITGKVVTKPKYAYVGSFENNGYALVNVGGQIGGDGNCVGGKYGYVDERGVEVVAPAYDYLGPLDENGVCWANKGGHVVGEKSSLVDKEYEKYIDNKVKNECPEGTDNAVIFETRAKYEKEAYGEKWDLLGNRITGGKFGVINCSGKVLVPVKYNRISDGFNDGRLWGIMSLKYKSDLYDEAGKLLISLKSIGALDYHNGVAYVETYYKKFFPGYYIVDRSGSALCEPEYVSIDPMEGGFAVAKIFDFPEGYKATTNTSVFYKFYDTNAKEWKFPYRLVLLSDKGQILSQKHYDEIKISNGIARCVVGESVGYVDSLGTEIVPPSLLEGRDFSHNVALVKVGAHDVSLNSRGGHIMTRGSYAGDTSGAKWGIINRQGVAVTDFIYDKIFDLSEGLFAVTVNGEGCGWIDPDGEYVIPLQYEQAGIFIGGYAYAKKDGKFGIIDKANNVIVDFAYDAIGNHYFSHRVFCVKDVISQKWGGLNENGTVVIPFEFDSSEDVDKIADEIYVPKGCIVLTDNDVRRFKVRQANVARHFSVDSTVPDGYWDY